MCPYFGNALDLGLYPTWNDCLFLSTFFRILAYVSTCAAQKLLHIVKDVVVVKLFPSIDVSHHPSMDSIIHGRKPWQK
jgi:hypothetical protein